MLDEKIGFGEAPKRASEGFTVPWQIKTSLLNSNSLPFHLNLDRRAG
jgi:hypothetical protein